MRTALKYNPECVTFFFIVMVTSYVQYTFGFWSKTERPMCIRLSCGPLCNEIFSFRLLVLSHAQPCRPWAFQVSSSSSSCSSCGLSTPVTGSLEVRTRFVACPLDVPGLDWISPSLDYASFTLRYWLIEQCLFLTLLPGIDWAVSLS